MAGKSTVQSTRYLDRVFLSLSLALIASLVSVFPALCAPDWMSRPGTIRNALSLPDRSHVYLDGEVVEEISTASETPRVLVREWFAPDEKIMVLAQAPSVLQLGQMVDIEGTVTTLPDGSRAVESATIYGYADSQGRLLTHTMITKGVYQAIAWPWRPDITEQSSPPIPEMTAMDVSGPPEPGGTSESPIPFASIGDLLNASATLADGVSVRLPGGTITSIGTDGTYGSYFVMADYDGAPPPSIRVYCTRVVGAGDRVTNFQALVQTQDSDRVLCINGGPGQTVGNPVTGTMSVARQGTIPWAKTFPDGTALPAPLTGKIVTVGSGAFGGCIYVEEPNRSAGIGVACSSGCPDLWHIVTINGVMATNPNGERLIGNAAITPRQDPPSAQELKPLSMVNRDLSGEQSGGVYLGANSIGLLVQTWGKVMSLGSGFIYVDDGAAHPDPVYAGLRVSTDYLAAGNIVTLPAQVGELIRVTGISGLAVVNGQVERVLRPRFQEDVDNKGPTVTINQAADQRDPTNSAPVRFSVEFSDEVPDFDSADVTIGGTAQGALMAEVTGSGKAYNIAVAGMQTSGTVLVSIQQGAAHNAVGNGSQASTSTDNQVMYDITAPTLTVSTVEPSAAKYGDQVSITVSADEDLADDLSVTVNSRATALATHSGSDYTYTFTPEWSDPGGPADIAVTATDTAGNEGTGHSTALVVVPPPAAVLTGRFADGTVRLAWSYDPAALPFDHTDVYMVGPPGVQCNVLPIRVQSIADYRVWSVTGQVCLDIVAYDSPSDIIGYRASTPLLVPTTLFGAAPAYQYTQYLSDNQMGGVYAPTY